MIEIAWNFKNALNNFTLIVNFTINLIFMFTPPEIN